MVVIDGPIDHQFLAAVTEREDPDCAMVSVGNVLPDFLAES